MEPDTPEVHSYRDLRVWQLAMDVAVACYSLTRKFPREEMFGLTSQVRRAANSVPANIAEGNGRELTGAYIQSLRIAQGSLKELETHLILAHRVGLGEPSALATVVQQCDELGRMIRALIRSLQARQRS